MNEKTLWITRLNVTYFILVNIIYEYISFLIFYRYLFENKLEFKPEFKLSFVS